MGGKKQEKLFFCRHLSKGAISVLMICLFLPATFLGVKLGDTLFIIWRYGSKAYADGLRFEDSKHGILNNGEHLRWYIDIPRGLFDFILVLVFVAVGLWLCDLWFSRNQRTKTE